MTILPKKKGPKERAEGTTSRGQNHGPPSPHVSQQVSDPSVAYDILAEPLVTSQNRAESGLEFFQVGHQQPGTSRASPLLSHRYSQGTVLCYSNIPTGRNHPQECLSKYEG